MNISKENARAHIVFDNDGTMIDSLSNFFELIEELLPKHLGKGITVEDVKKAYVPDWYQFFVNLGVESPTEDFIQAVIDDLNDTNKDYVPPIIPGTKKFIKELHDHDMATYVWTGRDKVSGMKVFNSLGLTELFTEMQFRDTSRAKPDPHGLEIMFPDIEKDRIVLIGDSIVDVKGARAFGIKCLVVDWFGNDHEHQELLEAGASGVVTTHAQAMEFILTTFK